MPFPAVSPRLDRALVEREYAEPTSVQSAVLEANAANRDLLVSAQTGSGKTVAFGLALAPTLLGDAEEFGPAAEPLALVIAPTRELALQVHRELSWLYGLTGVRMATGVGGMDIGREARALQQGAHIVVGTPGRLRDHLERGRLDISKLAAVVLDEADEMLDLGFREDLEFILEAAPPERRTLLFSATIAKNIAALAKSYQRDALRIDTVNRNEQHADIEYRAIRIAPNEIEHAVVNLLRFFEVRASLVFCSTRENVRHLSTSLAERGFACVALSGELSQADRNRALQALRDGRARVCVATDVAARGLDLPDLGLVIHADLPNDAPTLLHRSGRTGRAGRKGISAVLVPHTRRRRAEAILSQARVTAAWGGPPAADEIRLKDQERLINDPIFQEEMSEEDLNLGRALLEGRTADEIATALVRFHRARMPAPEDLYEAGPMPTRDTGPSPLQGDRPGGKRRDFRDGPSDDWVQFRIAIGRQKNADPRWLLPLICRAGHVTKKEIGAIRIFDRDSKFEVAKEHASRFAAAIRKGTDQEIRIEPVTEGMPESKKSGKDFAGKKPFKSGGDFKPDFKAREPKGDFKPREDYKPREAKPEFKPREAKADFKPRDDFKGGAEKKPFKPKFDPLVSSGEKPPKKKFKKPIP